MCYTSVHPLIPTSLLPTILRSEERTKLNLRRFSLGSSACARQAITGERREQFFPISTCQHPLTSDGSATRADILSMAREVRSLENHLSVGDDGHCPSLFSFLRKPLDGSRRCSNLRYLPRTLLDQFKFHDVQSVLRCFSAALPVDRLLAEEPEDLPEQPLSSLISPFSSSVHRRLDQFHGSRGVQGSNDARSVSSLRSEEGRSAESSPARPHFSH